MKTVILTVCMILAPTKCKDVQLTYVEAPANTPFLALFEAAKWARNNPRWYVKKIDCPRNVYTEM